ncbi:hypothetical protein D1AOALGA4SA_7808 [Olavius algarvensis Delta 1 endosymbiont]|nr:hypothetical protein D1AOALGA4SA_7808 [Olavius algarvensis Delta 1 endosymbiont]
MPVTGRPSALEAYLNTLKLICHPAKRGHSVFGEGCIDIIKPAVK